MSNITSVILADGIPTSGTGTVSTLDNFIGTTGTFSTVASSATNVTILAANSNRKGATVFNESTQILFLGLSATAASATEYTVQMAANAYYEVPFNYRGAIQGLWSSVNGNARVTEMT
jgi:accessory colonization factor AcfC